MDEADKWAESSNFDSSAAYYQHDVEDGTVDETPWQDVESYGQPYAANLDARKRIADLRLARGFLLLVVVGDPSAGNISLGVASPTSSPTSKGEKGKFKGSSKDGSRKGRRPPTSLCQLLQKLLSPKHVPTLLYVVFDVDNLATLQRIAQFLQRLGQRDQPRRRLSQLPSWKKPM